MELREQSRDLMGLKFGGSRFFGLFPIKDININIDTEAFFWPCSLNASSVVTIFDGSGTSGNEPCQGKPAGEGYKEEGR